MEAAVSAGVDDVNGEKWKGNNSIKNMGAIFSDEGSKPKILFQTVETTPAFMKLKTIWNVWTYYGTLGRCAAEVALRSCVATLFILTYNSMVMF